LKYHPDTGGESSSAEAMMLNEAYEILANPEMRKRYDWTRNERISHAATLREVARLIDLKKYFEARAILENMSAASTMLRSCS
jgi:DnaJ-class molecular chaperone